MRKTKKFLKFFLTLKFTVQLSYHLFVYKYPVTKKQKKQKTENRTA